MSRGGPKVAIVGAGVLGLTIALRLARAGWRPVVHDPARLGDNASGIAAGMIAPVFETVLDGDLEHRTLLKAARDLWPALAGEIGAEAALHRQGTLWVGDAAETERLAARDGDLVGLDGARARVLQPALSPEIRQALFTGEDWWCDPALLLAALRDAASAAGAVHTLQAWKSETAADAPVVIAGGYGARGLAAIAPELAVLTPIKGQLARFDAEPRWGAVVRGRGVYIVPGAGGAVVGASMEFGVDDRRIDPSVIARLRAAGQALVPSLELAPAIAQAGVRAATPDGLPLVGPSVRSGVLLAVGARRNGWLLAPLVADLVAAYLTGEPPGPFAAALDARRFTDAPRAV